MISLEIWRDQKISNNLVQGRTLYNLFTSSTIHSHKTLLKFCQMKWDSVASLVHNRSFHSLIKQWIGSFYVKSNGIFSTFSKTNIKDLYMKKVNCVKQKKIPRYEPSRLFKVSQENWFHQIFDGKSSTSFLLLTLIN